MYRYIETFLIIEAPSYILYIKHKKEEYIYQIKIEEYILCFDYLKKIMF
jgi:hypothetical protein